MIVSVDRRLELFNLQPYISLLDMVNNSDAPQTTQHIRVAQVVFMI